MGWPTYPVHDLGMVAAVYQSGTQVTIEPSYDRPGRLNVTALISGHHRTVDVSAPLTVDTSILGAGGRDRDPLNTNSGYDLYVIITDQGDLAGLAVDTGEAPVVPTGYTWISDKIGYLCINQVSPQFNNIMPFRQLGKRIWYLAPNDGTTRVVNSDSTTTREKVPFHTITASSKGQVPDFARVIHTRVEVINDNAANGLCAFFWNETDVQFAFFTEQLGTGQNTVREVIYIDIPIGPLGVDDSLWKEWYGAPGDPLVTIYVQGFSW